MSLNQHQFFVGAASSREKRRAISIIALSRLEAAPTMIIAQVSNLKNI
jgi:hypothetical protein